MASYTIGPLPLPSGLFVLTFYNDNGDSTDYNLTEEYVLDLASLDESVEENGIGGVLRIPSMDVIVHDRDGKFHDEIFDRPTVTEVQAFIYRTDPLTMINYPVIFGSVKLSTVEYETLYDNEAGTKLNKCSFTILGILDKLTNRDPSILRSHLDTVDVAGASSDEVVCPINSFTVPMATANDATVGTQTWTQTYYGAFPDGLYSEVILNNSGGGSPLLSKYLKLTNFDVYGNPLPFIPDFYLGWTVDGIEVDIKRKSASGLLLDNSIKLVKAGVIASNDRGGSGSGSDPWSTSVETSTYGSPSDLWGIAWSPSDFNVSNFGVVISVLTNAGDSDVALVDAVRVRVYLSNPTGVGSWVKVLDVFDAAALVAADYFTTDPTTHDIADDYTGKRSGPITISFDDLYIPYTGTDGSYYGLFADSSPSSFMGMQDIKQVVNSLASAFLVYVEVNFDISNEHVSFNLRRRNAGTAIASASVGLLMSSRETSFVGYDAVRTRQLGEVAVDGMLGQIATPTQNPTSMTDAAFNKLEQKFDFESPIMLLLPGFPYLLDSSTFYTVNIVNIDGVDFTDYGLLLNTKFLEYWTSPVYITRRYGDTTGIGGSFPRRLLDQITIDAVDYSIIETNRDFIENEMTVKMVEF